MATTVVSVKLTDAEIELLDRLQYLAVAWSRSEVLRRGLYSLALRCNVPAADLQKPTKERGRVGTRRRPRTPAGHRACNLDPPPST